MSSRGASREIFEISVDADHGWSCCGKSRFTAFTDGIPDILRVFLLMEEGGLAGQTRSSVWEGAPE